MDATCTIQDSIHVFNLVHKYVSRILGTYHLPACLLIFVFHYVVHAAIEDLAKYVDCMRIDVIISFKARQLTRAETVLMDQLVLRDTLIFHCFPKLIINYHGHLQVFFIYLNDNLIWYILILTISGQYQADKVSIEISEI